MGGIGRGVARCRSGAISNNAFYTKSPAWRLGVPAYKNCRKEDDEDFYEDEYSEFGNEPLTIHDN